MHLENLGKLLRFHPEGLSQLPDLRPSHGYTLPGLLEGVNPH